MGANKEGQPKRSRPATTPQTRENQLIAKAVDLAEQQLEKGTASAQVLSHYLKLGSSRERLEQERLGHENHFLTVKAEALESQKRVEEMYVQALNAMRSYSGQAPEEVSDEYDDYED